MFEQWVCAVDREGNVGCGFTLIMGVGSQDIPKACPQCGGTCWDILGDPLQCAKTGGRHIWRMGTDKQGLPHLDPNQICTACGAIPVMTGVTN